MPGILGLRQSVPVPAEEAGALLRRMAEPIRYSGEQPVEVVRCGDWLTAVVEHGEGVRAGRRSWAQRDGVLVLLDGEVFPAAEEVPPELRLPAATIQRAAFCLHRYLEEGPGFVERLNGTFGLAVVDERSQSVHLAADRFGHRLLFLFQNARAYGFASSVRSLLLAGVGLGESYDRAALAQLIAFERVLGDRTLFRDIRRLPGGCRAVWSGSAWNVTRYFTPRCERVPGGPTSWQEAAAELVSCLRRSLERRMADQAKPALFLSGGLDSRLVLGCAPRPVTAVTFSHPGIVPKEAQVACAIAKAAGVPLALLERSPDYYARIAPMATEVNEGLATFVGCHSVGIHDQLKHNGVQVAMTGDRSDVAFKAYFDGIIDRDDLRPWTGSAVQLRRAARKVMGSPVIRKAWRQDLMVLALSGSMKIEFAGVWEQTLQDLQGLFREGADLDATLSEMALYDWQGFTSMGMIRGLSADFAERSPFFDNDVWRLSLSIPPGWRIRARIVRQAIRQVSPPLARIPDVSTGIPPSIPWPWDGYYAAARQALRDAAKRCARFSKRLASLRAPARGTQVLSQNSTHDRDAALRQCEPYRELVRESIARLPGEYFDLTMIRRLFESDLAADAPSCGTLFEILVTFAEFDRKWGNGHALASSLAGGTN